MAADAHADRCTGNSGAAARATIGIPRRTEGSGGQLAIARGKVDRTEVHTAPEKIVSQQTVILTAMSPDGAHYGNATVALSEASLCIRRLAVIGLLVTIGLLLFIVYLWPKLSTPSQGISVLVSPSMVTLSLQTKQQ